MTYQSTTLCKNTLSFLNVLVELDNSEKNYLSSYQEERNICQSWRKPHKHNIMATRGKFRLKKLSKKIFQSRPIVQADRLKSKPCVRGLAAKWWKSWCQQQLSTFPPDAISLGCLVPGGWWPSPNQPLIAWYGLGEPLIAWYALREQAQRKWSRSLSRCVTWS